jgi:hypothetical protein
VSARSWAFLSAKPFLPDTANPFEAGLGGTEQAIIHLTAALAAFGDTVTVCGATRSARTRDSVSWRPGPPPSTDVTIAINDARLLPRGATRPSVWFHNEVEWLKELRRFRLPALLRARPTAIFVGAEQARAAPRLLPFRRRVTIPLGLPDHILTASPAVAPPPPHAIFTSQAYRGLTEILGLWQRDIAPGLPAARLTAYIAAADVPAYRALATHPGIAISPRIGRDELVARLLQARVLLAPGHRSETYCLAAAEAVALGVPVVTLGLGALKERVRHGETGFVCADANAFAARTRQLLTDDALWRRMQLAGIATRTGQSWRDVAAVWKNVLF